MLLEVGDAVGIGRIHAAAQSRLNRIFSPTILMAEAAHCSLEAHTALTWMSFAIPTLQASHTLGLILLRRYTHSLSATIGLKCVQIVIKFMYPHQGLAL